MPLFSEAFPGGVVHPPQAAPRVDWRKPLARGVRACWILVGRMPVVDAVLGAVSVPSSTLALQASAVGPAAGFASGSSQYVPTRDIDLDYCTIVAWVRSSGAAGENTFILNKNYDGVNVPYSLAGDSTSIANGFAFYDGAWHASDVNAVGIRNDGKEHLVGGSFDGTNLRYWLDGALISTNTLGAATVLPKNNSVVDLGRYGNNAWYYGGAIAFVVLYDRALSATEHAAFNSAVRQGGLARALLVEPRLTLATGTIDVQYLRPASDVAAGTWTPVPASPTTYYDKLDESAADDADYAYSATYPASDVLTVTLSSATDPTSSTGHVLRYRYRNNTGGGQGTLLVELLQGASTVIASWTHSGITSSAWTQANQTLSGTEADNITDYSGLRIRFTASVG